MTKTPVQFSPFVPHTVRVLPIFERSERESLLQNAHFNLLNLNANQITFDLYTDSGYAAISNFQASSAFQNDHGPDGMGHSSQKLRSILSDVLNYPYIILSAQGRSAEFAFSKIMVKQGQCIPGNITFFTTQYHQKTMGGIPIPIVVKEAYELQSKEVFKGNVDLDLLKDILADKNNQISFVNIETCSNAIGGYPISLENLKQMYQITREFGVPLILDSTRILENAYFIQHYEKGYESKSITEIVREIGINSDGCVLSLKKNFLANMGGGIGVRSKELFLQLRDLSMITGTEIPGPNMEYLSQGVLEAVRDEHVRYRVNLTKRLYNKLKSAGIPVLEPHSGHGVWIDIDEFVPHVPAHENPHIALQNALYLEGGIRAGIGHLNPPNRQTKTFIRLTLPHRLYSESHIDFIASSVVNTWKKRHLIQGYELVDKEPGIVGSFEANYKPVTLEPSIGRMVFNQIKRLGDKTAIWYFKGNKLVFMTYKELGDKVKLFASGLSKFGFAKGERVGFLTYNTPEAIIAYVSTACLGVVDVPMYYSYTPEQIKKVILDASAKYLIVADNNLLNKVLAIKQELPWILKIVHLTFPPETLLCDDIKSFEQINELGREVSDEFFEAKLNNVQPTDLLTIMYSSGTTGEPKGIALNNRAIVLNSSLQRFTYDINQDDIFMLIFKISHATGRYWMFYVFKQGAAVGLFNSDISVLEKLLALRPTILPAAPDFFEEVYQALALQFEPEEMALIEKIILQECMLNSNILENFSNDLSNIFRKIKKGIGGRVRYGLVGGTPVPPKLLGFYNAFGFPLLQTYGATETNIICSETFKSRKFGTVGKVRPGTLCRRSEDGELLVHSPYLMDGYYNKPGLTEEALIEIEGLIYYRTGDIVEIDSEGFVKIIGRKKDYFSLSNAYNVHPQFLEKLLCKNPLIIDAFVVGAGKDYVSALLVADLNLVKEKLKDSYLHELNSLCDADLVNHLEVRRLYCNIIHDVNEQVAEQERIQRFVILSEPFSEDKCEVSENGKKLRRMIHDNYNDLIESLYEPVPIGIG